VNGLKSFLSDLLLYTTVLGVRRVLSCQHTEVPYQIHDTLPSHFILTPG